MWTLVTGIATVAQYNQNAGPGAWFTGATCFTCLIIAILSLSYGEKQITRSDLASFLGALAIIPIWCVTKDPLIAVILASGIDLLGCLPTIRKSWLRPYQETLSMWVLAMSRSLLSLLAINEYSVTTVLFPLALTFNNCLISGIIIWRRRQNN